MIGHGAKGPRGQTASLPAVAESGLPERLSWPAAAAVIAAVSLSLWGVIALWLSWLIG